jgi:hypothetical protein
VSSSSFSFSLLLQPIKNVPWSEIEISDSRPSVEMFSQADAKPQRL